jgi:tRNA (cytosine38-C5)-methyltransferase
MMDDEEMNDVRTHQPNPHCNNNEKDGTAEAMHMPHQQLQLSMLEFFSGIGGMRIAVDSAMKIMTRNNNNNDHNHDIYAPCCLSSCRAYDISLHANCCYQHNFSHSDPKTTTMSTNANVTTKLVEHLKPSDIDAANVKSHLWTLSPPCQPFTTNGKNKQCLDSEDKRCNGLKSLMQLLYRIQDKPTWILLENVKGFAHSNMVRDWYTCLKDNGYTYKRYLLSPIQLGVPNHRLRFYVLAERSQRWAYEIDIHTEVPSSSIFALPTQGTVGEYLEENLTEETDDYTPYLVPDSILEKKFAPHHLGIVSASDTATHCFTAGYGRIYHRSTGSILLMRRGRTSTQGNQPLAAVSKVPLDRTNMLIYSGRLRRFTPQELLSLFGFPKHFVFPEAIPLEHQYKLIGNSISVVVVTALMMELLRGEARTRDNVASTTRWSTVMLPENTKTVIGGTKGHMEEEIDGPLLALYQRYRWRMIPNCTGRYTCRDHQLASTLRPVEFLKQAGIEPQAMSASSWNEYTFDQLPGRPDQVLVTPMNRENTVGLITFVKRQEINILPRYVHTLNTPSGFRRKLEGIGLEVTKENIIFYQT